MKSLQLTLAIGALCAAGVSGLNAQEIKNPAQVRSARLNYDYYGIGQPVKGEPSPSDDIVAPAAPPIVNGGSPCCDSACDSNGCDSNGCDSNGCGCNCDCPCYLFGPEEAWTLFPQDCECAPTIGGWLQFGYHNNPTPLSFNRDDLLSFNDVPDALNLHAAWLYIERVAEGDECCWGWGYRVDAMYGTDAQKTQAFGNPRAGTRNRGSWDASLDHGVYGWAIPQAYVEVARGDLSIIAGHFFTLVGYEVVTAPDNFFYSHALTMFNSEPFTHTGVLATYSVNDETEVYGGWTLGWDTGFDQFGGGSSFLGGFSTSLTDDITFTYISTAGNFGFRGTQAYSHSVVIDTTISEKLNYVIQSDLVSIGSATPAAQNGPGVGTGDDQVGINQYLFYTVNDCVKMGGRFEWWKSDSISHYELTGGINIKPHANIVVRPEVRYDWMPTSGNVAGRLYPAGVNNVTTFGIDAILTF